VDPGAAAVEAIEELTAHLPGGGERRSGQLEMAQLVAQAIDDRTHVAVAAGTGTGKSLAYLVPVIQSGRRTVIATATKALQDQLGAKDLPFLEEHLDPDVTYAVLKGRSNYVCRQRLDEVADAGQQRLSGIDADISPSELERLTAWAETSESGDREELDDQPSGAAWSAISVSARECPGAKDCPRGGDCFAEMARAKAAEADVVVVNTYLLGLHLAGDAPILPEHDVVVIDEAHQLAEVVSNTAGLEIGSGRFSHLARVTRAILEDPVAVDALEEVGRRVADAFDDDRFHRVKPGAEGPINDALLLGRASLQPLIAGLRSIDGAKNADVTARRNRAMAAATALADDLDRALNLNEAKSVAWIEGPPDRVVLRVAPIDVAEVLIESLWKTDTVVLTSATLPATLPDELGLPDDRSELADVGSPFDYEEQSLLYCAAHLPDPRAEAHAEAAADELADLIDAAGGRTLALFTSWRALDRMKELLDGRLPGPMLAQGDGTKRALIERFIEDESASLFATMGFWQGVDVPGRTLSLVVLDRIPFPRPDDPLLQARRDRHKAAAFRMVDLPRAATLMAQGAGRLIRSTTDRGVVAVLDPRLASANTYRWELIRALPPMRRTKDRDQALTFLQGL
jgi:ATP-dependent DNA helicase DinG